MQTALWDVHPARTEHHPGKLELCIGMPVLIKYNEATEAGVTNGAEGYVVGWNSRHIGDEKETLDTLFVKLKLTATTVRVRGLPDNVVPVSAYTKSIGIKLSDDTTVRVSRTQVPVVLNFGMTDYGSQGRSRPKNPFDPGECRSHQSLYTCLSRGTSWSSTILVRPIPVSVATGKLSEQLRTEFQQLELLNVITKLRYEGSLPEFVHGDTRTALLQSFQLWKGAEWCPSAIHPALKWSKSKPIGVVTVESTSKWHVLSNKQTPDKQNTGGRVGDTVHYIPAKGTSALATTNKDAFHIRQFRNQLDRVPQPIGMKWDADTWSCAYDAVLTILHLVYSSCNRMWTGDIATLNDHMKMITDRWLSHPENPNIAKTALQQTAHDLDPGHFPMDGATGTSVSALCELLFSVAPGVMTRIDSCLECGHKVKERAVQHLTFTGDHGAAPSSLTSTANIARNRTGRALRGCSCGSTIRSRLTPAGLPPPLIAVEATPVTTISATMTLDFPPKKQKYFLTGVVYYGASHFTSRLVDRNKNVWTHDGMSDNGECKVEGKLKDSPDMRVLDGRAACIAVYARW